MQLIAMAWFLLIAYALSAVINKILEFFCSAGVGTWGYYVSGVALSAALSITPSFIFASRNYGKPSLFGWRPMEAFIVSFSIIIFILIFFLVVLDIFDIKEKSVNLLFVITGIISVLAFFEMHFLGNVQFDVSSLVAWMCFAVLQIYLAKTHKWYCWLVEK